MKRTFSVIGVLVILTLIGVLAGPVSAQFVTPTISIVSVDPGKTVTIQTSNYLANDSYNVTMNYFGTLGVGGWTVATVNSGSGGSQTFTFNIPSALQSQNLIAIRLQSPSSGYFSYNWFVNQTTGVPTTGTTTTVTVYPTFSITNVVTNQTVSIQTANLPANDSFDVLMNTIGTLGIGGTKVTSISSGSGGTQTFTFNIPSSLQGLSQIAIRLQSPTSGLYAYNWFWNASASIPTTGTTTLPVGTIPTITILSVDPGKTVTIQTQNYPANDSYQVLMNNFGTAGIGGTVVTTINSGSGGSQTFTFNIPSSLANNQTIAIRLQSPTTGYFSYNWFYNNVTTGVPTTGTTIPLGTVPTITITKVVKDSSVTIQTSNYPANDTFNVYMNTFGTAGIGGTLVTSVKSGSGGTQTFTFSIPSSVQGQSKIAIRLQSPTSGLYSYNWFWNVTYP